MKNSATGLRLKRGIAGIALAGAALLCGALGGVSADKLVTNFDRIVFRTEFGPSPDPRVRKWTAPVRIYVDSRAGDLAIQTKLTATHMTLLETLTGLEIGFSSTGPKANVVIVFDRYDTLIASVNEYLTQPIRGWKDLNGSLCFGVYAVNQHSEIVNAVIGIPSDTAASLGKLPACIVEELTQVMGLPNDSDEVFPSIFNDHSPDDFLTEQDEALVRLLYDPRLAPGMERLAALDELRAILASDDPD